MIEIEMSRDIREFEPKVIGPFSTRQLVCLVIGAVIALPVALKIPLPIEYRLMIAIVLAAPAVACGFLKMYGMPAETFFIKVLLPSYINPKRRRYKTENTMEYLRAPSEEEKALKEQKEKQKIRYTREYRPMF